MWWKILIIVIILLFFLIVLLRVIGERRWQSETNEYREKMEEGRSLHTVDAFRLRELTALPAPVQAYFRTVLDEHQPVIRAAEISHEGTFNMSRNDEQWKPFISHQYIVTNRPGFIWNARINMMPAIPVHVHDAYISGDGVLTARLLGLFTVMEQPETPELARGELMRFLAEAVWYPTALLPSQGVHWESVDDLHSKANYSDGEIEVELEFEFTADGYISTVRAENRPREVDDTFTETPWEGRFWNYEMIDGVRIPLNGEVAWITDEGKKPYWRGRITSADFQFEN